MKEETKYYMYLNNAAVMGKLGNKERSEYYTNKAKKQRKNISEESFIYINRKIEEQTGSIILFKWF